MVTAGVHGGDPRVFVYLAALSMAWVTTNKLSSRHWPGWKLLNLRLSNTLLSSAHLSRGLFRVLVAHTLTIVMVYTDDEDTAGNFVLA